MNALADDRADGGSGPIVRLGSGGPWEDRFGYSRVVRAGPLAVTAGCTATVDGAVIHDGDPHGQALTAFGVAVAALARVGAGAADVIATRMYVTDPAHAEAVGAAHCEFFGAVRPVATMVVVAALIDPAMAVEVELTAWVG